MKLTEIQHEAKARALRWADVRAAYLELKEAEWAKRQRPNEIREAAWIMHTASRPGCWPFWRHGFGARFGARINRGADHTIIPGYDVIAQQIGWDFPEYATDDGTERLWEFLLSPYDRYPTADELYRKAMDRVEAVGSGQWAVGSEEETEEVPF